MKRKIIQIEAVQVEFPSRIYTKMYALCDDGTVHCYNRENDDKWFQLPAIPDAPVERSFIGSQNSGSDENSKEWKEGYIAGDRSSFCTSPYAEGSPEHIEWLTGYKARQAIYKTE